MFYRNMNEDKQFFFGRTVKTPEVELRMDRGEYGFRNELPLFFHSSLSSCPNAGNVMFVIETVLITELFGVA